MPGSFVSARFHADDNFGKPLIGGRLYTYANGTTIPVETYQDAAGTILNTNPIILDGRGEAVIFLADNQVFTFRLESANGTLIFSQDDIKALGGSGTIGGGLPVYGSAPSQNEGPVYIIGQGPAEWNGTGYSSMYSIGQRGGSWGFKNKVRNGDFSVAVRGTVFDVQPSVSGVFTLDNLKASLTGTPRYRVQQFSIGDIEQRNYATTTVTTASSPAASDYNKLSMTIEGIDARTFGMGQPTARTSSLSFDVTASIPGTYCGSVSNATATRSFVFTFIATTNFQRISIAVPSDVEVLSNWDRGFGAGIVINFDLGSGANFETANPNTWQNGNYTRIAGSSRLLSNINAQLSITNVQFERGSVSTPFEVKPYAFELDWNQRYCQQITTGIIGYAPTGNTFLAAPISFPTRMRGIPSYSLIFNGPSINVLGNANLDDFTQTGALMLVASSNQGLISKRGDIWLLDAEMSYV